MQAADGPYDPRGRGDRLEFDAASQLVHIDTAPPAHIDSTGSILPRQVALSQFSLPYSSHLPPPYPLPLHLAPGPAPNLLPTPTSESHPLSLGPSPSSAARTLSPPDSAQSKGKSKAKKSKSDAASKDRNSHVEANQADPQGGHPQIMVYPPPPPRPGQQYHPLPLFSDDANARRDYSLPPMGSWAPPRVPSPHTRNDVFASHSDTAFPTPPWQPDSLPLAQPQTKPPTSASSASPGSKKRPRDRDRARRPSQEEEEAGLALAGLGMGLSAGEMRARRDSTTKKAKVTQSADKDKDGKDGKKSCSECRRLKAKCDRQFPCSNCRRRGCALVCPDGDLSCMQGKRLVLASTEQLHDRIAQLETALFQAHSRSSTDHHPLLAPEYLDGGFASLPPPQPAGSSSPAPALEADTTKSPSSFTLHTPHMLADRSNSQGRMAVESLLLSDDAAAPEGKREDEWVGENAAPAMIVGTVGTASDDADQRRAVVDRLRKILRALPSREETRRRAEHFWTSSTWYQNILRREEFDTLYEPAVYAPTPANPLTPHKLACVLMVLTLDTYLDITRPDEEDPSIATCWDGAQRCFDTRFGWSASVAGVQALALATLFVGFGWRGALASNFYWLRMMTSQAQQLGLHKEPHWSLPDDEKQFRRRVFHEMWTIDCLISINHGQRTAILLENIETAYPDNAPAFLLAKYEHMRQVKSRVIDIGCRRDNDPASQETIAQVRAAGKQFDAETRPELHCPALGGEPTPLISDPTLFDNHALMRVTTSMCHYKAMLFLYRPSLRRLIARLRAAPDAEFTAFDRETAQMTYDACHAITACSAYIARTHSRIAARTWSTWVQAFSAAVSMAALAIWCGPRMEPSFTTSVYSELVTACDMIRENGSKRSLGVLSLLPILSNLVASRHPQVEGRDPATANANLEGEDMLFLLLGGNVEKGAPPAPVPTASPITAPASTSFTQDFAPFALPQTWGSAPLPLVHPQTQWLPNQQTVPDAAQAELSPAELWARLQAFYEPTMAFWQGGMEYAGQLPQPPVMSM